jgi:hypothetical protein
MYHFSERRYASKNVCVKDIGSRASMVLQNYPNLIEITSNVIYIVALGVGLKCPHKIHLNTQWGLGTKHLEVDDFSSKFPTKNSYAN